MLRRSFVHLPGIGASKEKMLWSRGVQDWDHLLSDTHLRSHRLDEIHGMLKDSQAAWERRDAHYFYEQLPRPEIWRLVPEFVDDIAYLDIETNGLNLPPHSQSTTVTFYFRGQLYQEWEPRAKELLLRKMDQEAAVFCTYYGEVFDVPFLRREFGLPLRKAQIDLCFWLKRLGFNGGLKRVEKYFEHGHQRQYRDIDGFDAVRLWRFHLEGRAGALDALLTYNAEDALVLEGLLTHAYNLEIQQRPHLGLSPIAHRAGPALTTRVADEVYTWLT